MLVPPFKPGKTPPRRDTIGVRHYYGADMSTLIEHILKLTDHRDRDLLELTLSKALIDILPIQRIVIARVMSEEGEQRWLEVARLDSKGGGKLVDPMRVDFQTLPLMKDAADRLACLQRREIVEIAWAGPDGPRINMLPLFSDSRTDEEGVIEVHSEGVLSADDLLTIEQLRRIYRNMYSLLEYSDRDALTGLLNRKSLDDAFYSAVLEELDGITGDPKTASMPKGMDQDRRHRVPANYWLGSATVDNFGAINDQHGHLIAEEVLLLVARVMNNTFRTYDRIYRFGGEHFGVLLHCPDEALVLAAFERFRVNVEKFNFPQVGKVTVSCGFTSVMANDSPSSALEKTERAVDFAQRSGHNKVCSHLGLVRRGFFGDEPKVGGVDLF
jgi:diguanylate cyclase (GGDEF)-like protein